MFTMVWFWTNTSVMVISERITCANFTQITKYISTLNNANEILNFYIYIIITVFFYFKQS